jgi:hypothetical protein
MGDMFVAEGRGGPYSALSGLRRSGPFFPRALPWAIALRPRWGFVHEDCWL